MKSFETIAGIEPLIEAYEGFLLDQFGVLHDGVQAFPGAIEALDLIRDAGRKVIILSNSGKRSAPNIKRLEGLGIERYMFDDLLSSGETAWLGLQNRSDLTFAGLGHRCFFISRGGDQSAVEGLPIETVESPLDADFVLLTGLDPDPDFRRRIENRLEVAVKRKLPMVCTNPDKISLEGDERVPGPGSLADHYEGRGGEVRYVGKPWPAIYRAAIHKLNLRVDRIVAVGDSLHHDIKGAEAFGIDGAIVTNGVHREALASDDVQGLALKGLAGEAGVTPRWVLPDFAPTKPTNCSDMRHAS